MGRAPLPIMSRRPHGADRDEAGARATVGLMFILLSACAKVERVPEHVDASQFTENIQALEREIDAETVE